MTSEQDYAKRIAVLVSIWQGAAHAGSWGVAIIVAQTLDIIAPGWQSLLSNDEPPLPEWVSALARIEVLENELAKTRASLAAVGASA